MYMMTEMHVTLQEGKATYSNPSMQNIPWSSQYGHKNSPIETLDTQSPLRSSGTHLERKEIKHYTRVGNQIHL
jgi:hypothetical protein